MQLAIDAAQHTLPAHPTLHTLTTATLGNCHSVNAIRLQELALKKNSLSKPYRHQIDCIIERLIAVHANKWLVDECFGNRLVKHRFKVVLRGYKI